MSNRGGQLDPSELQEHVLDTYLTLRIGIAVLAFAFPFLLLLIGKLTGMENPGSMSAYYWAEVRRKAGFRVLKDEWFLSGCCTR